MISGTFDIQDFVDKTLNIPFDDFIILSNQEATEAERYCLKNLGKENGNHDKVRRYANSIKALIRYVRYEVCTGRGVDGISGADLERIKAKSYTTFI